MNPEKLKALFLKHGKLQYCGVFKSNTGAGAFALVHYNNSESPRHAMAEYQVSSAGNFVDALTYLLDCFRTR